MDIGQIEGCTRVIGEAQGYRGLPILDVETNCSVNGEGTPAMLTAWIPSTKDLELLNAGAPIILQVLGRAHPPVLVFVPGAEDEG